MMKSRIISALLSIFMMLMSNTLRADDVISQFHILGGELSNSAATSVSDIDEVLPRMKVLGLNTVLVPVYWWYLSIGSSLNLLRGRWTSHFLTAPSM